MEQVSALCLFQPQFKATPEPGQISSHPIPGEAGRLGKITVMADPFTKGDVQIETGFTCVQFHVFPLTQTGRKNPGQRDRDTKKRREILIRDGAGPYF